VSTAGCLGPGTVSEGRGSELVLATNIVPGVVAEAVASAEERYRRPSLRSGREWLASTDLQLVLLDIYRHRSGWIAAADLLARCEEGGDRYESVHSSDRFDNVLDGDGPRSRGLGEG
jgi:hypothetical protein